MPKNKQPHEVDKDQVPELLVNGRHQVIPADPAKEFPRAMLAAGAVLWRGDLADLDSVEVAVIHRPSYDDWSLAKGKVDPGESLPTTATREILEETGFEIRLGKLLGKVTYPVGDRTKVVYYWTGEVLGGEFTPNDEVDELLAGRGGQSAQDVDQIGERLDVVHLTRSDEAEVDRGCLAAAIAAHRPPILAADGDAAVAPFGLVVVGVEQATGREHLQRVPLIERVTNRFAQVTLGQHAATDLSQPDTEVIQQGNGLGLAHLPCKRPADYVLGGHCILTALGIYQVRFRRPIDGNKSRCEPARDGEVGRSSGAAARVGTVGGGILST